MPVNLESLTENPEVVAAVDAVFVAFDKWLGQHETTFEKKQESAALAENFIQAGEWMGAAHRMTNLRNFLAIYHTPRMRREFIRIYGALPTKQSDVSKQESNNQH